MTSRCVAFVSACFLGACSTIPRTVEQGEIEINKVTGAIECELAAVAANHHFAKLDIPSWGSKSALDLTVVNSLGADGKVVLTIPSTSAATKLTPSLALSGKYSSIAHLDFATSIKEAVKHYGRVCVPGRDPSDTGLGLASWFEATLLALESGSSYHAGMSYTTEFQLTAAPSSRFGYKVLLVDTDVGVGTTHLKTHRLTVAISPPPPPYRTPRAIPVYVVDKKKPPLDKDLRPLQIPISPPVPRTIRRAPPLDEYNLNRMLQQKAPLQLEP